MLPVAKPLQPPTVAHTLTARGKNFAAAEKMYLVEVAAVDLGLYDSAYDGLAGGDVGAAGDHVFSTLVNW